MRDTMLPHETNTYSALKKSWTWVTLSHVWDCRAIQTSLIKNALDAVCVFMMKGGIMDMRYRKGECEFIHMLKALVWHAQPFGFFNSVCVSVSQSTLCNSTFWCIYIGMHARALCLYVDVYVYVERSSPLDTNAHSLCLWCYLKEKGIVYPVRPHYWGTMKATGEGGERRERKKSRALDWSRQGEGELTATINWIDKLGGVAGSVMVLYWLCSLWLI